MRLSEEVVSADVEEAIRLMKVATQTGMGDNAYPLLSLSHKQVSSIVHSLSCFSNLSHQRRHTLSTSNLPPHTLPPLLPSTAATDPRTGTIDMDMITTGRTASDREAVVRVSEELRLLFTAQVG